MPAEEQGASAESLVKLLRTLILQGANGTSESHPAPSPAPSRAQAVFVVLFIINIVLLVSVFPGLDIENPLLKVVATVIPPILGGTLIGYLQRVRAHLFRWAGNWSFRTIMIVISVVLLGYLMLEPWAGRVEVRTDPYAQVSVPDAWQVIKREDNSWYATGLSFRSHKIAVSMETADGKAADSVTVGGWELARAFLGRAPIVGRLFDIGPIRLAPRLPVTVKYDSAGGRLEVHGKFSEWFLRSQGIPHENSVFNLGKRPFGGLYVFFQLAPHSAVYASEIVYLPPGNRYLFVLSNSHCQRTLHVSVPSSEPINFWQVQCPAPKP